MIQASCHRQQSVTVPKKQGSVQLQDTTAEDTSGAATVSPPLPRPPSHSCAPRHSSSSTRASQRRAKRLLLSFQRNLTSEIFNNNHTPKNKRERTAPCRPIDTTAVCRVSSLDPGLRSRGTAECCLSNSRVRIGTAFACSLSGRRHHHHHQQQKRRRRSGSRRALHKITTATTTVECDGSSLQQETSAVPVTLCLSRSPNLHLAVCRSLFAEP